MTTAVRRMLPLRAMAALPVSALTFECAAGDYQGKYQSVLAHKSQKRSPACKGEPVLLDAPASLSADHAPAAADGLADALDAVPDGAHEAAASAPVPARLAAPVIQEPPASGAA